MGSWKSSWLISEAIVIIKSMLCEQAYPLKLKSRAHEIKDFVRYWIRIMMLVKKWWCSTPSSESFFSGWTTCVVWGRPPPIQNEQFTYCLRVFWQEILWWCLEPGWCPRSISLQRGGDNSSAGIAGNMLRRTGNKKHKNKFPFYCLKIFSQEILLCAVGEGTATRRDQRCDKGNRTLTTCYYHERREDSTWARMSPKHCRSVITLQLDLARLQESVPVPPHSVHRLKLQLLQWGSTYDAHWHHWLILTGLH